MKRELYWRAVYSDGEELLQYEGGKENKYPNIDRERLQRFDLLDFMTNKPVYSLWINEGEQLIFRRRTLKPAVPSPTRPEQVIYMVGYKYTYITNSGVRNRVIINYIYEDGSVALDGARDNLELYPIEM